MAGPGRAHTWFCASPLAWVGVSLKGRAWQGEKMPPSLAEPNLRVISEGSCKQDFVSFLLRIGNIKVIIVDDDNKPGALVK